MAMFDVARPIWIRGTVVRYEAVNPHALIALDRNTPRHAKPSNTSCGNRSLIRPS
jgi:Family of unknown function (DUF6152)